MSAQEEIVHHTGECEFLFNRKNITA